MNVTKLIDTLRRPGPPSSFLQMVLAMLQDKRHCVYDSGTASEPRAQRSGISQGCTLSPLLFVVAMSVLLHDAVQMLRGSAKAQYSTGDLADLVYADDTLLIGITEQSIQEYLAAIYKAGQRYGMELHFGKFQLISTAPRPVSVRTPDGTTITSQASMDYLGAVLHGDGSTNHDVIRRIALARSDFDALSVVWSRSALTRTQKLDFFISLIESKLLYSLAGAVFTKGLERRLNGFQNRCIRKIIGVAPSWISRVSNTKVLEAAAHRPATESFRKRRLQLFGKVLRCAGGHPLRDSRFMPGTWIPITDQVVRRVGRPCKEWIKEVLADAVHIFGSLESAIAASTDKLTWNLALVSRLGY